jgi:hypothetical protein
VDRSGERRARGPTSLTDSSLALQAVRGSAPGRLELFLRSHNRFSAVADVERTKDREQMHLDGSLRQAEFSRDQLVRHSPRQQRKDLELPLCQAVVGSLLPFRADGAVRGRVTTAEQPQRRVRTALKDQAHRLQDHRRRVRFRNEAGHARVDQFAHQRRRFLG